MDWNEFINIKTTYFDTVLPGKEIGFGRTFFLKDFTAITTIQNLSETSFPNNLASVFILTQGHGHAAAPRALVPLPLPQAKEGAGRTEVGRLPSPLFQHQAHAKGAGRNCLLSFGLGWNLTGPFYFAINFSIQAISWLLYCR